MAVPDGGLPLLTFVGGLFSGIFFRVFGEKYREKGELDEHAFSVLRDEFEGDLTEELLEPLSNQTIPDGDQVFFRPVWDDIDPHYRYLLDDDLRDELAAFDTLVGEFYSLEIEKREFETDRAPGDALYYSALRETFPILISTVDPLDIHERLLERAETTGSDNLAYAVTHWEEGGDGDDWSKVLWRYIGNDESQLGGDEVDEAHRRYWETIRKQRRTYREIADKLSYLEGEIERRHSMSTTRFIIQRYRRILLYR